MQILNEAFTEHDLNPFMVFSSGGKLLNYNREAEYLFSFVLPNKLYEVAVNYAPKSFGTRSSHVNLRYDRYTFCALLVGYFDDEKIGIKLYKEMTNIATSATKEDTTLTNLFALLELSKNSLFANKDLQIKESLDPTLPEMKLHVQNFLKLLNRIFTEYVNAKEIEIIVRLKIGQNLIVEGKSYPICNISIINHDVKIQNVNELYTLASAANVMVI
jgi:hypothetical protein